MIIFIILTWKIWLQHLQNVFVKKIALIRQILKEKENRNGHISTTGSSK